jgi:hypothetical protein
VTGVEGDELSAVLAQGGSTSLAIVLAPSLMKSRVVDGAAQGRKPTASPVRFDGDADDVVVVRPRALDGGAYVGTCSASLLRRILVACAAAKCRVESITPSDFAWGEAVRAVTGEADALAAVQLPDSGEARLYAVHRGEPALWRRLPLEADATELARALAGIARHLPGDAPSTGVVALGDPDFRARVEAAALSLGCTLPPPTAVLTDLDHEPMAVAAAFAGTGPRFVLPEVVAQSKARTRRRGIVAAAAAFILLGLTGLLDTLDVLSEIDRVRAARQAVAAHVSDAVDAQEEAAHLSETVATLEGLRATTPRWTAILGALAGGLPRSAYARSLRAVGDSVYVELESDDVAAAVEGLRGISWWTGLRTVSAVETEVGEDGGVTERLTVAAFLTWEPLNAPGSQAP